MGFFKFFDHDGNGTIDFAEFTKSILGADEAHAGGVGHDIEHQNRMNEAQKKSLQMLIKMGQTGSGKRWTMEECKDELARRVGLSLRSGPNARVRAFQVFKRGGTKPVVRLEDFMQGIQKYNMIIPQNQAEELFNSYDQKGLGEIHVTDFINQVLDREGGWKRMKGRWNIAKVRYIQDTAAA